MINFQRWLLALALCTSVSFAAVNPSLAASLITANSEVARLALLQNQDFVFNFVNNRAGGSGGTIALANSVTFPANIGSGMSMAVAFLAPCGLSTPHTHARADEFLFSVNGTLLVGMIEESGAPYMGFQVPPMHGTLFPKGSIHFQQNLDCTPSTFVSGLNSDDPGVLTVAQRYTGLPPEIAAAALGNITVQDIIAIEANLPDSFAIGIDSCLKRCGIVRTKQPSNQRQARVAANALSSGSSGPSALAQADITPSNTPANEKMWTPLAYGLSAAVAAMAIGYIVIAVLWYRRRNARYVKAGERFAPLGVLDNEPTPDYYETPYSESRH